MGIRDAGETIIMENLSYLTSEYAREMMVEQYHNEEKKLPAKGENKPLMAPRTDALNPLTPEH